MKIKLFEKVTPMFPIVHYVYEEKVTWGDLILVSIFPLYLIYLMVSSKSRGLSSSNIPLIFL